MVIRPPGPAPSMTPSQQPPQHPGESNTPMYSGPRFPGPHQSVGMRSAQGSDAQGQFPQQTPLYQGQGGYSATQYPNFSQTSSGGYPGPRPPGPSGMYGTPNKRFPDEHTGIRLQSCVFLTHFKICCLKLKIIFEPQYSIMKYGH